MENLKVGDKVTLKSEEELGGLPKSSFKILKDRKFLITHIIDDRWELPFALLIDENPNKRGEEELCFLCKWFTK